LRGQSFQSFHPYKEGDGGNSSLWDMTAETSPLVKYVGEVPVFSVEA
jgi:hypothetical protein